jgi:nucleoside-diphosphate-sugar epimerase
MNKRELSDLIVSPDSPIADTIKIMSVNGIRGVFVCDNDRKLLGIIMDSDFRRAELSNLDLDASSRTLMRTNPFVIGHDLSFHEKKQRLIKSDKLLAPIVDDKKHVVDYIYLPDFLEEISLEQEGDSGVLPPKKILVIGGAGYIGSILTEKLLRMGYCVRVLDLLVYGKESIEVLEEYDNLEFIKGDCRDIRIVEKALNNVDAAIHLAEIVGDPACEINESFTIETNYFATQMIAEQCLKQKIRRLIFMSSCSVYGQNDDEVNEDSQLNPVSLYARCKIESEKAILSFSHNFLCPTILRLATVHGMSHRQRFDLVVNLLSIKASSEKKIQIFGGEQWRPFISVEDVCHGIITVLHSESKKVKNQIFNLGDSRENYQLRYIGENIKKFIPDLDVQTLSNNADNRNYKVSFNKIKNKLAFSCEYNVSDSIKKIIHAYNNEGEFQNYMEPKYHNVLTLKNIK